MEDLLLLLLFVAFAYIGGFVILSKSVKGVEKSGTKVVESYKADLDCFIDEKTVQQIKKQNKNKKDLIDVMTESPASDETFEEIYKRMSTKPD